MRHAGSIWKALLIRAWRASLSGGALVLAALFSSNTEKGNVARTDYRRARCYHQRMVLARYRQLDRTKPDAILAVKQILQSKTLVDLVSRSRCWS